MDSSHGFHDVFEKGGDAQIGRSVSPGVTFSSSRSRASTSKESMTTVEKVELIVEGEVGAEEEGGSTDKYEHFLTWFYKRNEETLRGARMFVPAVLQRAYQENVHRFEVGQIEIHHGSGAVLFLNAEGFTTLTELLSTQSDRQRQSQGSTQQENYDPAEKLSLCMTQFFTPVIDLITAYRGDVIKFSGGTLMVYFQAVDDTKSSRYDPHVPPHGTFGLPDIGPMATAVLRACACSIEIRKRWHNFATGVNDLTLRLCIGIGSGDVHILQVGGVVPPETTVPRCEYLIAGPPLEQISVAEPLAPEGCACLSPQAWAYAEGSVIEGRRIEERPEYRLLDRLDESKYTFPTIKHSAKLHDCTEDISSSDRDAYLNVLRRFIPAAVFKQIEGGTLMYVNEMRVISVLSICGAGLDVMMEDGAARAQELVVAVQRCCYQHEGTLNKFFISSKGMQFLLVWGLPPLVHTDDPTRAVLACFDILKVFQRMNIVGRFGLATGRSYCGICGSASRCDYTVLGDCVNRSAALMSAATPFGIRCDETTKARATTELIFNALAPIRAKDQTISVFLPLPKASRSSVGLTPPPDRTIHFPWHEHPFGGAVGSGNPEAARNVEQLCSLKTWAGMVQAMALLGFGFDPNLYKTGKALVIPDQPNAKAPPDSPFSTGGVVIVESRSGNGKLEIAEHMVTSSLVRFRMMPVFGTMGPRPGESMRLALELVRSTLAVFRDPVFRETWPSIPEDDCEALRLLAPESTAHRLPLLEKGLRHLLGKDAGNWKLEANPADAFLDKEQGSDSLLWSILEVVLALIRTLAQKTSVLLVLQFEYGTSVFPKKLEDQQLFLKVMERLEQDFEPEALHDLPNPMVLLLILPKLELDQPSRAVDLATLSNSCLQLEGLEEENITEYMSNYLGVPDQILPAALRTFVSKVTLGNPLYIRETLDQLLEGQIQVQFGANNQPKKIDCQDFDTIDVSTWQHTAMVSTAMCTLESFNPLEAAVLKMSTCFRGSFTLPDLAASACPRWADATLLDILRLFQAIRKLVERQIIKEVNDSRDDIGEMRDSSKFGREKRFELTSLLFRAVGASMILEARKKSVKRQALMDRALSEHLPKRMAQVAKKKAIPHIPWYYEQACRKMKDQASPVPPQ